MTVYLVWQRTAAAGAWLCGIYASLESARAASKRLANVEPGNFFSVEGVNVIED